ncbi:MAG: hypothetical protein HY863_16885 [Chloroflexi bacterium]|nr:hypothetical protein [Chloroflexota bacterium]
MNAYVWSLRILGVVMGAFILLITLPKLLNRKGEVFPGGFKLPGLALEWEKESGNAAKIIKPRKDRLSADIKLDTRFVIPLYVLYYVALAWFLNIQGASRETYLAVAVTICIIVAGFLDLRENSFTSKILDNFASLGDKDVSNLTQKYLACYGKWALIAIVILLTGIMLIWHGNNLAGIFNLLVALVFLAGFIGSKSLTEWGFALMGFSLILIYSLR